MAGPKYCDSLKCPKCLKRLSAPRDFYLKESEHILVLGGNLQVGVLLLLLLLERFQLLDQLVRVGVEAWKKYVFIRYIPKIIANCL